MKKLPQKLQRLMRGSPEIYQEGWVEQDDFGGAGKSSYWLYLKPGWINQATETHCIHECTVEDVMRMSKQIVRCKCEDCRRERAK